MYSIAGLTVLAFGCGERFARQAQKYVISADADKPDIVIAVNESELMRAMAQEPSLCEDDCRYLLSGMSFYFELLRHNGFMLHSSAVAYEGKAYVFSADSGVGKSTHAGLWQRRFAGAYVINDDKPAIRMTDGGFYAFGTPWSGKHDVSRNIGVPLAGVAFIERAQQNSIERVSPAAAVALIMGQTMHNLRAERMNSLLELIAELVEGVPVYRLRCNMDDSAAELAYTTMNVEVPIR